MADAAKALRHSNGPEEPAARERENEAAGRPSPPRDEERTVVPFPAAPGDDRETPASPAPEHPALRSEDEEVGSPASAEKEPEEQPAAQPAPPPFVPKPPLIAASYVLASVLIALTQGLGMNFVAANLNQIAGSLGATSTEATWLMAAYMAPNVSLSLLLIKMRAQFGIRNFAEAAIVVFVAASLLHLWVDDLQSALVVRFFSGVAASPMSSLGFLYMLEPFPPEKKLNLGLCLALANISIAMPVARLVSPYLLDLGGWHNLYLAEIALAMMSFAAIYLLPLTSPPRAKVIGPLDVLSYSLIAVGFGSLAVVLVLGRVYWWTEAPWLGVLLAVAVAGVTLAAAIELNRKNPLLDIRWLTSREVVHFTAALLIFRIVLSEQSSGVTGFFRVLGLSNAQMASLYWVILAASVLAGLACAAVMKPGREPAIHAVALSLLIAGAAMDSQAMHLTRPEQMYVSQAMIAAASGLFLPPALASGLMAALKKGPNYILSFVIVFLTTQALGGLFGAALFGTFVTIREKFHSHAIAETITMTDPMVAQRIAQLGGAYGKVLTDPALRQAQGLKLLGQQATQEAWVLAYNDAFLMISWLAAFALACLLVHILVRKLAEVRANAAPSAV